MSTLAERIYRYHQQKGYQIAEGSGLRNICYIEGASIDGTPNRDDPDHFNDRRIVWQVLNKQPVIIGNWDGTTEPGSHYTYNPMNPGGAARIQFGQHTAWQVGIHGNSEPHEALVQVAPVTVHRDFNQDFARTNDKLDTGLFGINQHYGYDMPVNSIGYASAGCLVGRTRRGHKEFMTLIKQDRRYQANHKFIFPTTVIPGDVLATATDNPFQMALRFVLKWEGGAVDHPLDPGGRTNFGITQVTYDQYRKPSMAASKDVFTITKSEVEAIYQRLYWTPAGCDGMVQPLAIAMFDTAVNFGVGGAVSFLQEVLGLKPDGLFGPVTKAAISKANTLQTAIKLCDARIAYRYQRVKQKPDQQVFLAGWLNRDRDLKDFIA